MLALRLHSDIEQRLDALTRKTGRSKSYYAREAILRHIEDIEDYYLGACLSNGVFLDDKARV
jgi:RHH-type rel operon transcriptional repressor/antitoxin RelB